MRVIKGKNSEIQISRDISGITYGYAILSESGVVAYGDNYLSEEEILSELRTMYNIYHDIFSNGDFN